MAAVELPLDARPQGFRLAHRHFAVLLAAALAVSMAYGVTLPLLPGMLTQRMPNAGFADIARHTGWLTGIYTLALFACSPAWGSLSDRINRRWVVVIGLLGSGVTLWLTEHAATLSGLYLNRIASGVLSAAVLPAVFACVVDASSPGDRPTRFAWITAATALGFLLGPVVGNGAGSLSELSSAYPALGTWVGSPFMLIGGIGVVSSMAVLGLPRCPGRHGEQTAEVAPAPVDLTQIRSALLMTALVVLGITIAEVGLTLLGQGTLALGAKEIAGYFAFCSIVMVVVQMFFYPRLEQRVGRPRVVRLALLGMALGIGSLAWPVGPWVPALAFLLGASGAGILLPALALHVAEAAGNRQGRAMGNQAAAANLGQAAGAAITGVLYARSAASPFIVASIVLAAGALIPLRRPRFLTSINTAVAANPKLNHEPACRERGQKP